MGWKRNLQISLVSAAVAVAAAGCIGGGTVSAEEDALAKELKSKYSAASVYSGIVMKVGRKDALEIKLGYNPWSKDEHLSDVFRLYQDADLKYPVEAGFYDYDADTGILTIMPPFYGIGEIDSSEVDLSHLSGSYLHGDEEYGWGTLPQYYLVTEVDTETGEKLETPVITVIKVCPEILQAPQLVFDQTEEGLARFKWQEVPGAEGYLVFNIHKDDENGLWDDTNVFADTDDTVWVGDMFENEGEVLSMNSRFCYHYTSEDDMAKFEGEDYDFLREFIVDGDYDEFYSEYYGVIAYNSEGCSSISNLLSGKELASMLPMEIASFYNEDGFWGLTSVLDLPATMGITMCDGTLAQKIVNYDFENVYKDTELNSITITGRADQTAFTWEYKIYDLDLDEVDEQLELIRQRQEKLKSKGGTVAPSIMIEEETETAKAAETEQETEEVETEEIETESAKETEEAAVEEKAPRGSIQIKVTANSAMSEYIATYMLESKDAIDISAFPEAADTEKIVDAFFEAQYQNPLILGVQGGGIDPENRILYVDYDFEKNVTAEKQAVLKERVAQIVSEIITEDMSDIEKEMAINAYLCENAYYDDAALENAEQYDFARVDEEFYDSFTAYGVLVDGVGVCASYSAAFKLLADAAGLESIVVTGYLDGSTPHAWNKVKLDDQWYIVDTTNNDNEVISNALLNLSDEAAYGTLVENEKFVMDSHLYEYTSKTDELEYYHMEEQYFSTDEVAKQLADLLENDGKAVLRTEYHLDDETFAEIAQEAANLSQKDISGFYWMGVINLEE